LASIGDYKENILRNHFANKVPTKYHVSTGFALSASNNKKKISRQTDILIWDSANHSPFYRDNNFVIVPTESVKTVIEVKSTLNQTSLSDAIDNLDSYVVFKDDIRYESRLLKCIFAYDLDPKLKFPDGILNKIYSHYQTHKDWPLTVAQW
jgi:hypothetical protein